MKAHELACFAAGDSALSNCETTTGRSKASYGVGFRARFVSKCKAGFHIPVAGLRRNLVPCYTCTNSGQGCIAIALNRRFATTTLKRLYLSRLTTAFTVYQQVLDPAIEP